MHKKRVAYVVNNAAFFVSHRLPLAIRSRQAGFDVCLLTGKAGSEQMEQTAVAQLRTNGVVHQRVVFRSSGMNPLIELMGLFQLIGFMIKFKPDIVHCASPKGVLYGGIAARLCRTRGLVLAISGMGYAYTAGKEKSGGRFLARLIFGGVARFVFHHPNVHVIVQNQDDYQSVVDKGLAPAPALTWIQGSGVDLSLYASCSIYEKRPTVLLPARMLKDKGVLEFVNAVRKIKSDAPNWRFVLAGAAGYDNPSAIAEIDLRSWQAAGWVEWLGHVDDMVPLYREAAIVCLPSYREGMPKALLEAAAAGCAVLTTDVTGCREAIESGVTGDLVPVRDSEALATALLSLIKDRERRQAYGLRGQERANAKFSIDSVVNQTIEIYKGMLSNGKID